VLFLGRVRVLGSSVWVLCLKGLVFAVPFISSA